MSALEADDWHLLPGEVVGRGFLRNYADYLGLDPQEVMDRRRAVTDANLTMALSTTSAGAPLPPTRQVDYRPKEVDLKDEGDGIQRGEIRLTPILAILAVAAVVALGWWGITALSEPLGDLWARHTGQPIRPAHCDADDDAWPVSSTRKTWRPRNARGCGDRCGQTGRDYVGQRCGDGSRRGERDSVECDLRADGYARSDGRFAFADARTTDPDTGTADANPGPPTPTLAPPTPTPAPPTPVPPTPVPEVLVPTDTPTPEAPVVVAPSCPDPRAVITNPGVDQVLSGVSGVSGTATHEAFQYYKLEYAPGANAAGGYVYFDGGNVQISGGLLGNLNTASLANGAYTIRLTVVDQSGNFPEPCDVNVVIQN